MHDDLIDDGWSITTPFFIFHPLIHITGCVANSSPLTHLAGPNYTAPLVESSAINWSSVAKLSLLPKRPTSVPSRNRQSKQKAKEPPPHPRNVINLRRK
jgi:hypothetical protein